MNQRDGFFLLAPIALFVAAAFVLSLSSFAGKDKPLVSPLVKYAPCLQLVVSPQLWACSNGHSYLRQGHAWRDIGRLSPVPKVPSS